MFTSLINPASARRRAAWLKDPPGPHLYAFVLAGVADPLDPDPLWEHRYSGAPDIHDKATGLPERRLRETLDAHRQRRPELDQRGRLVEALYVYTDVVASLPRKVWRNAIKAGGARLAMLANNLAVRHAEDFKADLPAGRLPRYVLRPADALADDEVGFAFGNGVFVPGEDDVQTAGLRLWRDQSPPQPLAEWEFFLADGRRLRRPAGLYREQRFLLLTAPEGELPAPAWLSDTGGYLLLAQTGAEGRWQAFGDDEAVLCLDEEGERTAAGRVFTFATVAEGPNHAERLHVQVQPLGPPPPPQDRAGVTDWGKTVLAGRGRGTLIAGASVYALWLEGVALPRIDGPWALPGLKGWVLWLDERGNPEQRSLDAAARQPLAALAASRNATAVNARPAGGGFAPIQAFPYSLRYGPSPEAATEVVAAPIPDRYLGVLQLANPVELLLEDGARLLLGRSDPAGAPGIALDFLHQPDCLIWESPRHEPYTLNNFGLSRRHLHVRLDEGRGMLRASLDGLRSVSYVLAASGRLRACLRPGQAEELDLAPDDRLLLGPYLLRFARRPAAGAA